MGEISDKFSNAFRDFQVSGVPASGPHEPVKSEIRAISLPIEAGIAAAAIANNLPAASELVAPLLSSAQAAQAAAEGALLNLDQALDAIPESVAEQLNDAVASATAQADASRDTAALAAATALAASRYFPSRSAGEAGSSADQLFSTDDGAGNLIYYRRTPGGSIEIGRAVTPVSLAAPTGISLVGRFDSVTNLLASAALARGEGRAWQAGSTPYVEAAAGASDQHVTTAGGVKLYAVPISETLTTQSFGIDPDNSAAVNSDRLLKLLTVANGRAIVAPPVRLKAAVSFGGPVNIRGAGMPAINAGRTALEGGTIIEGALTFTHPLVDLADFGVDHGSAAFATGSDALKISAAAYNSGQRATLRNVVALGRSDADSFHAILLEGYAQAFLENVVGSTNRYCFAIKSRNVQFKGLHAIGGQNGVIFKSDGTSAGSGSLSNVTGTGLIIAGNANTVYGVRVLADNQSISNIAVDNLNIDDVDYGLVIEAATGVAISEVQFRGGNGRNIRKFGIQTGGAGALYEAMFDGFNLVELGDYAAQFQTGSIKLRNFYGSMKAGATTHATSFMRAEATLTDFSVDNMALVENYGTGATKPALLLNLNPLLTELTGERRYLVEGNVPEPGFNSQSPTGANAALVLRPDLNGKRSTCVVTLASATTVTSITQVMPGTTTNYPRGYLVTIMNASASTLTLQNNANIRPRAEADLTLGINKTATFIWLGSSWHQVN